MFFLFDTILLVFVSSILNDNGVIVIGSSPLDIFVIKRIILVNVYTIKLKIIVT